jgi:hypothetical protein
MGLVFASAAAVLEGDTHALVERYTIRISLLTLLRTNTMLYYYTTTLLLY